MEGELEVKPAHKIELEEPQLNLVQAQGQAELVSEAEEKLTHINASYSLNDYFLPRGLLISMFQVSVQKTLLVS